jgi:hypothetical protein
MGETRNKNSNFFESQLQAKTKATQKKTGTAMTVHKTNKKTDIPTNNFNTTSINATASASLAFQVGPTKDGRVMIRTHTPIRSHPNPYQLLDEEPLFLPPSPKTLLTWSGTCDAEFQRHLPYLAFPAITNAQRLAHPWKTRRQEENRQRKQQHDTRINLWLTYIHDPTQVLPPPPPHRYPLCWWPTTAVPQTTEPITQATTIRQNMNQVHQSPVPPRIQYMSHRNDRQTATIRSAHEPTSCVLPSADPYSSPTTSDPLPQQTQAVALPIPPF